MCGRFVMVSFDEVRGIVHRIEQRQSLLQLPDWPLVGPRVDEERAARLMARPNAYPGSRIVVFGDEQTLGIDYLTWGFAVDWQRNRVFNTRIESALSGRGMWRESIEQRRCIVPTAGFFEPHAQEKIASRKTGRPVKRPYLFGRADGTPTLLAGVFDEGQCSIVTTQPNSQVAPVHNRMPLVLEPAEVSTWIHGTLDDIAQLADCSRELLAVAPEDALDQPRNPHEDDASSDQLSLF